MVKLGSSRCHTYPHSEHLIIQTDTKILFIPFTPCLGTMRGQLVERFQKQNPGVEPSTPAPHSHPSSQSMFCLYPFPVLGAERQKEWDSPLLTLETWKLRNQCALIVWVPCRAGAPGGASPLLGLNHLGRQIGRAHV